MSQSSNPTEQSGSGTAPASEVPFRDTHIARLRRLSDPPIADPAPHQQFRAISNPADDQGFLNQRLSFRQREVDLRRRFLSHKKVLGRPESVVRVGRLETGQVRTAKGYAPGARSFAIVKSPRHAIVIERSTTVVMPPVRGGHVLS